MFSVAIKSQWLETIIKRLTELYTKREGNVKQILSLDDITTILLSMVKVLMEECSLIEIEPPVKIIGDIHGQYQDMQRLFDLIGRVPDIKLLFLGDYVDRGPQSLETIMYLFTLKLRYKDRIFLLRGNHEIAMVNRIYGFYAECATKYGAGIWWDFQSVFNRLPIAALISGRILCMHGGLSPNLNSLDQIRQINRPCEPAGAGTVTDLLWADPTNKGSGWFFSPRGISYAFGKEVVSAVCRQLHIDLVIRGHQVVQDGYEIMTGRMLITVFSAPNYAGQFNNAAAAVCLDEDLKISFQQIRIPPTNPNCTRTCPPIACDPGKSLDPPPILKKHRTNSPAALEQTRSDKDTKSDNSSDSTDREDNRKANKSNKKFDVDKQKTSQRAK